MNSYRRLIFLDSRVPLVTDLVVRCILSSLKSSNCTGLVFRIWQKTSLNNSNTVAWPDSVIMFWIDSHGRLKYMALMILFWAFKISFKWFSDVLLLFYFFGIFLGLNSFTIRGTPQNIPWGAKQRHHQILGFTFLEFSTKLKAFRSMPSVRRSSKFRQKPC